MKNKHPFWMKLEWRGARPLTLRELIMKSNFETMMKYIIAFDKKMTNQASHFYRACECIRDMKVKYDERYFLAENNDGVPFIMALEGSFWHHCLGSPVKRAKGLCCSDTQLAAQCLWHLTFYGYTPKEQKEKFDRENEELERETRNDELCLCDDIYTDEEIKEFALSGLSRVRDEVLERLFTPEEIVEIKKRRKAHVDAENARRDAADEEERKQLEQDVFWDMEQDWLQTGTSIDHGLIEYRCSECGTVFEARDIGHYRAQHPFPSRCPQCHHTKTMPTSETNQHVYEPVWRMLETVEQTKKAREWKKLLESISAGL